MAHEGCGAAGKGRAGKTVGRGEGRDARGWRARVGSEAGKRAGVPSAGGRREGGRQVAGGPEASSGPVGRPIRGRRAGGGEWACGPRAVVGARRMGSDSPAVW